MLKKLLGKVYKKVTFKYMLYLNGKNPDVGKWKEFLNEFQNTNDDFELSYNKYRCRMYYFPLYYRVLANLIAMLVLVFIVPVLLIQKIKVTNKNINNKNLFVLVKSSNVGYEDILPQKISQDYGEKIVVNKSEVKKWHFNKKVKEIFWESVYHHPFSFYYNFIILKELCAYASLIDNYSPKAIVVYVNERNIAGPLISNMCEGSQVDFVTFMHGDYILHLIQGFMRFSKFYVWDEHYTKTFVEILKCPPNQFEVYKPKKLEHVNVVNDTPYEYYATYYFGAESIERINKVAKVFENMRAKGKVCKVRPHPRRSNLEAIYSAFKEFEIEEPTVTSLEESMKKTEYVVGLNSTVLLEAYYNGKKVVIDDYSEPSKYRNLKRREYIMLYKDHKLLTELGDYT